MSMNTTTTDRIIFEGWVGTDLIAIITIAVLIVVVLAAALYYSDTYGQDNIVEESERVRLEERK